MASWQPKHKKDCITQPKILEKLHVRSLTQR